MMNSVLIGSLDNARNAAHIVNIENYQDSRGKEMV